MLLLMAAARADRRGDVHPWCPGLLGHDQRHGAAEPAQGQRGGAADGVRPVGDSAVPADGPVRHAGRLEPRLFKAAAAFVGHIRGGLAMAAILGAAAFGAVCGSSVATAATITQVAYPEMKRAWLPRAAVHGHARLGRHAGHPDPAVGAAGGVCHPDRTEHRQAVCRGHGAGADRDVRLPRSSSPSPAGCARNWRSRASRCRGRALAGAARHLAHRRHLHRRLRRHLRGFFSPTEGAAVGAVGTFVAGLAQRELGPARASSAASSAPPRPRPWCS